MKNFKTSKRVFALALCALLTISACAGQDKSFNPIMCEEKFELTRKYVARRKPSK